MNGEGVLHARDEGERRVAFSSSLVYGNAPGFPRRVEQPTERGFPYGVGNPAEESCCRELRRTFSGVHGLCLGTAHLSPFHIFVLRQGAPSSAGISRLAARMQRGEPPVVYGDVSLSHESTNGSDMVSANLPTGGAGGALGSVLNVASDASPSILWPGRRHKAVELLGVEAPSVPRHPRPGEVRRQRADMAREALGAPAIRSAEALTDVCRSDAWVDAHILGGATPGQRGDP